MSVFSRDTPFHLLLLSVFVGLATALVGCGGSTIEESWPPQSVDEKRYEEMGREWRDGHRFEAGKVYRFNLGTIPEDGVFRYGVREGVLPPPSPVHMRLFGGDTLLREKTYNPNGRWAHDRFDVSAAAGEELVAEFESEDVFWLGGLELFTPSVEHTNLLVVLMDTLRRDRLSTYGYERDASPNFDALANESVVFDNLIAQSSWTRSSIASLFTSTYPETHGTTLHLEPYAAGLPMFTKALQDKGYYTQAYVANVGVNPRTEFGNEFEHFVARRKFAGDENLVNLALEGMESASGRPWFTYVHLMGVHSPYDPPEDLWNRFQPEGDAISREEIHKVLGEVRLVGIAKQVQLALMEGLAVDVAGALGEDRPALEDIIGDERARSLAESLYDSELLDTDGEFKRIIDLLKDRGEYDNTLILVLSDHGEGFWEHGLSHHGNSLYFEQLDIPLLIKRPHRSDHKRVAEVVEHVDIAPTIAELMDFSLDWPIQGRSMIPLLDGTDEWQPKVARSSMAKTFSLRSLPYEAKPDGQLQFFRSVRDERYKIIRNDTTGDEQYFDVVNDPMEKSPLPELPEEAQHLRSVLKEMGVDRLPGMVIQMCAPWNEDSVFSGTISGEIPDTMQFRSEYPGRTLERVGDSWRFRIEIKADPSVPFSAPHYSPILFGNVAADANVNVQIELNGEPFAPSQVKLGFPAKTSLDASGDVVPSQHAGAFDKLHPSFVEDRPAVNLWYSDLEAPDEQEDSGMDDETAEELKSLGYF